MSIEICKTCTTQIDTDWNVEQFNYETGECERCERSKEAIAILSASKGIKTNPATLGPGHFEQAVRRGEMIAEGILKMFR